MDTKIVTIDLDVRSYDIYIGSGPAAAAKRRGIADAGPDDHCPAMRITFLPSALAASRA